jgi:peptidoglycan/xylan/chitin deacetylase (PgdA/CDA1 family)
LNRAQGASPGSSIVAVDTAGGPSSLVLTYDDGPEPGGTDAVLTVLADAGVTATFFVLLSRVRRHPALLRDTVAAGHEIALHGPDHRRLTQVDPATVAPRTRAARHELEDLVGRPVRWFRPPYGAQSAATWRAIDETGLTPVMWNARCLDWLDLPDDDRLNGVREAQAGAIVLTHDGFADGRDGVDDGPPPPVQRDKLARSIIELCAAKGLVCGSLSQALSTGRPVLDVWLDRAAS